MTVIEIIIIKRAWGWVFTRYGWGCNTRLRLSLFSAQQHYA